MGGNIEIHRTSGDWKTPASYDKAYNSVILHIAENINEEIYNEKGQNSSTAYPCLTKAAQ